MGKRRADADQRRFFDEFKQVRISRFRAMGVVDPSRQDALIPFPDGKTRLLGVTHNRFPSGGGWSFFVCPGCARRRVTLYLIDDAPRCAECCGAMNIRYRAEYGFGRNARRQVSDRRLDLLIAKLESTERETFKPMPQAWWKKPLIYRSRRRTEIMRRDMIRLRLHQLASQQAASNRKGAAKAYQPLAETRSLINTKPIWRASSTKRLQQALDKAQSIIIAALDSDKPELRAAAARLMLRTKQARERGLT